MGVYRAILWGLLFYPGHPDLQMIMIPAFHYADSRKGQAYILAMFGVFCKALPFFSLKRWELERRGQGYLEGLRGTGKIYILVVLTLLDRRHL